MEKFQRFKTSMEQKSGMKSVTLQPKISNTAYHEEIDSSLNKFFTSYEVRFRTIVGPKELCIYLMDLTTLSIHLGCVFIDRIVPQICFEIFSRVSIHHTNLRVTNVPYGIPDTYFPSVMTEQQRTIFRKKFNST